MRRHVSVLIALLAAASMLSGCGLFFGGGEEAPTPTVPARTLVPTFTPTAVPAEAPTPVPPAAEPTQVITVAVAAQAPVTTTATTTATAAVTATTVVTTAATAPPAAQVTPTLKIEADVVNVRLGPDTTYGLVGTANQGERFEITGRNADKSWYQVCCVNGQQGWVNTEFTDEENEELAPLVEVATQPVAQAQPTQPAQPAAPAPAEPTATPAPAPAPAPADACAGIGGDGCKFKLRGGPTFAANGGGELKLQLHFIHSGVDGGQPQGSYFVWLEKDGQKLPVSDGVRSIALQDQGGTMGKYNYEYKLPRDQIPGGNVAGNYAIWVLDGNGERDSQTFNFSVPDGQGEVWMQFDQG